MHRSRASRPQEPAGLDGQQLLSFGPHCCVQVEQALQWGGSVVSSNLALYREDYVKLFVDTIREAYLATAPWLNFVDTSPSSGLVSLDPYVKRHAPACNP